VPASLPGLAREFAAKITHLLNTTICTGVRIAAVVSADPNVILVGHGLTRSSLVTECFPVRLGQGKPRCWLDVGYRLCLDEAGDYLSMLASFVDIYAADDDRSGLCHFDYERGKQGYPEAHLQVYGDSTALANWENGPSPKRGLDRLHFPVGGRRYRPILEDVVEFLVTEQLADARDGWDEMVEAGRREYHQIQLRAAIRRDPQTARDAIAGLPPETEPRRRNRRP